MKVKVTRPCGNRYLIKLLETELSKKAKSSKLILDFSKEVQAAKRDICLAKVLLRGLSCKIEADKERTLWASEGDYVLVNRYSWFEVPSDCDDGLEMIVNDEDILAIVEVTE